MISTDEDALICDLAETYNIYNYKELPVRLLATLSTGLRDNSRIKMKMSGMKVSLDTLLLIRAVDRLSLMIWMNTKDAAKNRNRPTLLEDELNKKKTNDVSAFSTSEDFMERRNALLSKGG